MRKGLMTKVIFLVASIALLLCKFLPVCRVGGKMDYFLLWILVCPFGIQKMFLWLVPEGFGIAGTIGVVTLNFIVGGRIGGVVAVYRLVNTAFYLLQTVFGMITGKGKINAA